MIFRPRSQPYPFGSSIANQTRDLTWVAMSTGMEGRMAQASKGGSTAVVPLYLVKAYYFASFCYFATYVRYATLYFEAEAAGYTIYTMCWTSPRRFSPSASASARAQFHLRPPDSPLVVFACKLEMSTRAATLNFISPAHLPAACSLCLACCFC